MRRRKFYPKENSELQVKEEKQILETQ